jgi:hypothetical protein
MVADIENAELSAYLNDWLMHASGFFIDPTVRIADDLRGAPLAPPSRRMALPAGAWILLERSRLPFVLAGIERRRLDGRDSFLILEFCVTGASRVSFWKRTGDGEWDFISDASSLELD